MGRERRRALVPAASIHSDCRRRDGPPGWRPKRGANLGRVHLRSNPGRTIGDNNHTVRLAEKATISFLPERHMRFLFALLLITQVAHAQTPPQATNKSVQRPRHCQTTTAQGAHIPAQKRCQQRKSPTRLPTYDVEVKTDSYVEWRKVDGKWVEVPTTRPKNLGKKSCRR